MFGKSRKKREKNILKDQSKGAPLITFHTPKSIHAEQFRTIRTNLDFVSLDKTLKSIVVTSSIPGEGKSTVSSNLAYVMAATEKKVLIIDADMRKPVLHKTFSLNNSKGLSTLISQPDTNFNDVIQYHSDLNLYLMPSGPIPPNPSELLGSARMNKIVSDITQYFDMVIFDTPPVTAVTDAQIMGTKVDGVILVVRNGYVAKEAVKRSKEALDNVNANILGYVMNSKIVEEGSGYYAYYGGE